MRSSIHVISLAFVCAVALCSCGGSGSASMPTAPAAPSPPSAQAITVAIVGSIGNQAYNPNPVAAAAGDTVTFRNNDAALHHIVLDDGSADLGEVAPGTSSRGVTVRTVNPARFHCTIHPSMVGTINGSTAPEPPPCANPYGYGC
jgi:plastocyanin